MIKTTHYQITLYPIKNCQLTHTACMQNRHNDDKVSPNRINNKEVELNQLEARINNSVALAWRCLVIAVLNLSQHKIRTATASFGIIFAIFLIFLQLGFLQSVKKEATLLYEYFDFDLAMISKDYQFLYSPPSFDRIRLTQARSNPEVTDSFNLNVRITSWTNPESQITSSLLLLGLDQKPAFITDTAIKKGISALTDQRSILLDSYSHSDLGARKINDKGEISNHDVTVSNLFQLGLFFYAEGAAIVNNQHFNYYAKRSSRDTSIGFLRVKPDSDIQKIKSQLNAMLPDDVQLLTKAELIQQEQNYFVNTKPIGIIFKAGVFIALVIGSVILFQVLSAEINNRMREFATLKAIGFSDSFVYGIGATQTLIFTLLGYIPALILANLVFNLVYNLTHLPTMVSFYLMSVVFFLVLGMSLFAGVTTLYKVRRADPVELF